MTTYQHNLTLSDGEMIMIQSALLRMIVHCEVNLSDGIKAPYWAVSVATILAMATSAVAGTPRQSRHQAAR